MVDNVEVHVAVYIFFGYTIFIISLYKVLK